MIFSFVSPAIAGATGENEEKNYKILVEGALDKASDWLIEKFSGDSHWFSIAIARSGKSVPASYLELLEEGNTLPDNTQGQHGKFILGILAAGGNPTNIGGKDLYKSMIDNVTYSSLNIYGAPWDLAALDAVNYELPEEHSNFRTDIVNRILRDSSFRGTDPDVLGFASVALYPYNTNPEVKEAMDLSVEKLSEVQQPDGGFKMSFGNSGSNANSSAQALMAITLAGADPTGEKFTKDEGNLIEYILSLQNEDGSFNYMVTGTRPSQIAMATEQVTYALAQYLYYLEGKGSIWDFSNEVDLGGEDPNKPPVDSGEDKIKEQLTKNLAYLVEKVPNPTFGTGGGEWTILSLARGEYTVPEGYYDTYYNNVVNEVKSLMPESGSKPDGRLDRNKGSEHSRLILGLTAIGKDITNVGDYDIREALADFAYVSTQGINGPIFALIAFDSHQYEIPVIEGVAKQTTKEQMIDYILDKEIGGGGWALTGSNPDPDITAMAIQALTPYYNGKEEVKSAIDRAIAWLSSAQTGTGGYASWGTENSESVSQVIVALTGLGINPHTDERFIKNGKSAIDNLMSFAVPEGGFKHIALGSVDMMATDQGTYALVAYDRFINGKTRLYEMTDVIIDDEEVPEVEELPINNGNVTVPKDNQNYKITVEENHSGDITITIPEENQSKTFVELPANVSLPNINAEKGNVQVNFPAGIQIKNGAPALLELITANNREDTGLKNLVNSLIVGNKELDEIDEAITMGGDQKAEFTGGLVTITFKGMAGKEAAFIDQSGVIHSIQKFSEQQTGLPNGKHEYAYENGTDLVIVTDHFTDFIVYSVQEKTDNGGGTPPGGGGGETTPSKSTITLSIDKKTINKGYVLQPTKVEFTKGESVWDVLKRELDQRGIKYEYSYSNQYDSVYVESIAGDGEFDHGQDSGWMYNVNGWYPNYGASQYKLKDGDKVEWRYTRNLGVDLGEDPSEWENPSSGGVGGGASKPETELPIKPNEKNPVIDVPNNSKENYVVTISKELKNAEKITINIPSSDVKVSINLEAVKDDLPYIEVKKGDKVFVIEKGTKLSSGRSTLEVFTDTKNQQQKLTSLINDFLVNETASIVDAFEMGSANSSATFDKLVTLTLQGKKGKKVGFIDAKGKWHEITIYESEKAGEDATKDAKVKTYTFVKGNDLIVKTNHFTTFVLYSTEQIKEVKLEDMYKDANQISSWARDLIQEATQLDFIEGHAGKVNPKSNVTRAEFAKLMVSVLGLELETEKVSNFKDVKQSNWFYPYVNTAYKEKVVLGYNDQFLPNDKITREEMATMIGRALGIENTTSKVAYKDDDHIAPWAKSYVDAISALDLMEGYNNRFNPKDVATREMAIVVAMRAYHYNSEK